MYQIMHNESTEHIGIWRYREEEEEEKKEHDGKQCTWYESKLTAVLWMTVDDRSV